MLLPPVVLFLLAADAAFVDATHLSRRKRYIVFPEGSSLQLVFEMAVRTVTEPRQFIMSYTIGTAWELPGDAKQIVEKYKLPKRPMEPAPPPPSMPPPQDHFDDWGDHGDFAFGPPVPVDPRKKQQDAANKVFFEPYGKKWPYSTKNYWYNGYRGYSRPYEVRLHRRHRRDAYLKLESLLITAGLGGRACVLRALCDAGQRRSPASRGSFLRELLLVLFTLPPNMEGNDEDTRNGQSDILQQYDEAHSASGPCHELYGECSTSLFELWAPESSL